MGALGIVHSAGKWLSILQQRFAALRRYNRIALNVQHGREENPTEIPEPLGTALRDPPAVDGVGFGTAPSLRRSTVLSFRRVAALSARYEPCLGAGLLACARRISEDAARQARPDGVHLGVRAPFLRRHSLSFPRPQQGDRDTQGAHDELRRLRCEHRADDRLRLAAMVNRVVVGAHYGLGSWLAQRITAVVMALYTVVLLAVLMKARPIDYF